MSSPRVWNLTGLQDLHVVRRHARELFIRSLEVGEHRTEEQDDAVGSAIMVLDELASNALRHGGPPAVAEMFDEGDTWLIVVTDRDPEQLPEPATDRPEGQGGYGLHVVADFTVARGFDIRADHKQVWARLQKP